MPFSMPARRPLLLALFAAAACAVPPFSALAQAPASSPEGARSRGAASRERKRFGNGSIGIALLVPPANGMYRRASAALVDGVRAAHARDGSGITVEVIEIDDDLIFLRALYDELHQRGFSMVLGPLTRDAAALIAQSGQPPVFTLTLNPVDGDTLPANMLSFGLSVEAEARQAADVAWNEARASAASRPQAVVLRNATPLGRRTAAAFVEQWRHLGGEIVEVLDADVSAMARMRADLSRLQADVFFVAAEPLAAQAVRVSTGGRGVIYGTSRLNTGAVPLPGAEASPYAIRSPELDGVRLIDMPWRVQPDHPAVMAYARPDLNAELQKLYALGIDAFRLARRLLDRAPGLQLDGVTGQLRLSSDRGSIEREGVLAEYRDGVLTALAAR